MKSNFITPSKFDLLIKAFPFLLFTYLTFSYFLIKNLQKLIDFFEEAFLEIKLLLQKAFLEISVLGKNEKALFYTSIVLLSLYRLYFINNYYIHIDEAFSYVFIVNKGFPAVISYYPGPNNHVGYLFLVKFFDLFFSDPKWALRLPTFFASILLFIFQFVLVKRYFGFYLALSASILFGFSEYGNFYSTHGRGYILLTLLTFLSYFFLLSASIRKQPSTYYFFFIISSSLAFYTLPTFLYPFLTLIILTFFFLLSSWNIQHLKYLLISCAVITGATLFLYLPILTVSGIDAIIGNRWVKSLSWVEYISQLPLYLWKTSGTFYSLESFGGLITLINILAWITIFFKPSSSCSLSPLQQKRLSLAILFSYSIPFLIISLQRVLPFHRVWLYQSFFEYTSLTIASYLVVKPIYKGTIRPSVIIFFCTCYILFFLKFTAYQAFEEKGPYGSVEKFLSTIDRSKDYFFYISYDTYNVMLRYEGLKQIDTNWTFLKYGEQQNHSPDFIILKRSEKAELDKTIYHKVIIDAYAHIYKKRLLNQVKQP
ncbi:glycosyltransferase family 39 protein [Flammeovirgaceae bacterium SG7u.111]|nr:glycosyltransferase family 39 protein [Flammeovirgaceae bacterium SG7u.132]WPO35506.1 glycosyltransferase family 39 protein [Flammeovirgaceae bacterium SG7u.111]